MLKKNKAQKSKKNKTLQQPKQTQKGTREKLKSIWQKTKELFLLYWHKSWKTFVVFSVFLGVFAILYPRPMVSPPTAPVDNDNPFSVSFDIYNNGFLPLYDCGALIGLGRIGGADTHLSKSAIYKFKGHC